MRAYVCAYVCAYAHVCEEGRGQTIQIKYPHFPLRSDFNYNISVKLRRVLLRGVLARKPGNRVSAEPFGRARFAKLHLAPCVPSAPRHPVSIPE